MKTILITIFASITITLILSLNAMNAAAAFITMPLMMMRPYGHWSELSKKHAKYPAISMLPIRYDT